jgi:hypothetical protein
MCKGTLRSFLMSLSVAALVLGLSVTAFAANGEWNSVIRPMVNAGTGTADYSIELFSPIYQTGDSMLFISPRFRYNYELNDNEVNAGIGYRQLISPDWYLGGNVFYDTLRSENHFRYNQIGVGVEARSKWADAIFNGYIPVGKDTNRLSQYDMYSLGSHDLMRNNGIEQAMAGMDGEVGVLIPYVSDYVETRAYAGGYWWLSDVSKDLVGVKARVEASPVPLVTLNGTYNWDDVRGSVWRGEAYLNIPFSFENVIHGENPFEGLGDAIKFGQGARDAHARMTDRVERDRDIQTIVGTSKDQVEDHAMIYVDDDNEGDPNKDGSLEHPWGTIGEAQTDLDDNYYDVQDIPYVYVFSGTYYDPIDFSNYGTDRRDAVLWGEGYALPGMPLGTRPLMDLEAGDYGVYHQGYGYGGSLSVFGMNIQGNENVGEGIGAYGLDNVNLIGNMIGSCYTGIDIESGDTNINVANNDVWDSYYAGIYIYDYDYLNPGGVDTNLTISGNRVWDNGGDGIYYDIEKENGGNINVVNTNNQTWDNGWFGEGNGFGNVGYLYMDNYDGGGSINLTLSGNQSYGNSYIGLGATIERYASSGGGINVQATHNDSSYNTNGLVLGIANYGTGDITVNDSCNTTNNNYFYEPLLLGIGLADAGLPAYLDVIEPVNGYTEYYVGDGGVGNLAYVYTSGDGAVNMDVNGNTSWDNDSFGIFTAAWRDGGSGIVPVSIAPLVAVGSYGSAGDVNMNVNGNDTENNGDTNIYANITQLGYGSANLSVSGNEAEYSGVSGIRAYAYKEADQGDVNVTVNDNIANNNYATNIHVEAERNAILDDAGNVNVNVSGNQADYGNSAGISIYGNSYTDGDLNIAANNNQANGNYYSNIRIEAEKGNEGVGTAGNLNITANGNIADAGMRGIYVGATTWASPGSLTLNMSGNETNWNAESGLDLELDHYGTGDVTANLSDNTASFNDQSDYEADGIYLDMNQYYSGNLTANLDHNTADHTISGNGISVNLYNDGDIGDSVANVNNTVSATGNDYDGLYVHVETYAEGVAKTSISNNHTEFNGDYEIFAAALNYGVGDAVLEGTGNTLDHWAYEYIAVDGNVIGTGQFPAP